MKSNPLNTISHHYWDQPVSVLTKGKKILQALSDAGLTSIRSLIYTFPYKTQEIIDLNLRHLEKEHIHEIIGKLLRTQGVIISVSKKPAWSRSRKRVRLFHVVADFKCTITQSSFQLQWFNCYPSFIQKIEKIVTDKKNVAIKGEFDIFHHKRLLKNSDLIPLPHQSSHSAIELTYSTINGLTGKTIKKLIDKIDEEAWKYPQLLHPDQDQWFPEGLPYSETLMRMHGKITSDQNQWEKARSTIVFHYLLEEQLQICMHRHMRTQQSSLPIETDQKLVKQLINKLPYKLTADQNQALAEVCSELKRNYPMARLLQGDVGCGKTTIAFLSALIVYYANCQVAIMCPTEALAHQHYRNFQEVFNSDSIILCCLHTASTSNSEKKDNIEKLQSESALIVFGTHSLFQGKIQYKKLKYVVIDEQHKFGVKQRNELLAKGTQLSNDIPHLLMMSATPIPRTLQLTQFGDVDITTIKQLPGNRKPVKSRIVSDENYQKFLSFLKTRLLLGEQVYVVVPAIEESGSVEGTHSSDLKNIEEVTRELQQYFPEFTISVLHGKQTGEQRQEAYQNFLKKNSTILVATTVIEVGIDNPNATVMVVYNANHFGLSTLHQLRGRVGRGSLPGFFFMIALGGHSKSPRLHIIEKSSDGFAIAEEDLKLRGAGEITGTAQSGDSLKLKIYKPDEDNQILSLAHAKAYELSQNANFFDKLVLPLKSSYN